MNPNVIVRHCSDLLCIVCSLSLFSVSPLHAAIRFHKHFRDLCHSNVTLISSIKEFLELKSTPLKNTRHTQNCPQSPNTFSELPFVSHHDCLSVIAFFFNLLYIFFLSPQHKFLKCSIQYKHQTAKRRKKRGCFHTGYFHLE